jgi:hypothetical protein
MLSQQFRSDPTKHVKWDAAEFCRGLAPPTPQPDQESQGVEPGFLHCNPHPEQLPPMALPFIRWVGAVRADGHYIGEAADGLLAGVPETETLVAHCDGSLAFEQPGGPGDFLSTGWHRSHSRQQTGRKVLQA